MKMKRFALAAAVASAFCVLAAPASATQMWDWSYSGSGVNANGTLVSESVLNGLGGFTIDSISGMRNGVAITGMDGLGGTPQNDGVISWDNTIYAGGALDFSGMVYDLLGGSRENVYLQPGYNEYTAGGDTAGINVDWSAKRVPEPLTLSIFGAGLFAAAAAAKKRKEKGSTTLTPLAA